MDLFAKDHPLEAAALRTQSAKCVLRSLKLPPTVRHRIFRELLLKPQQYDIEIGDSYSSEHEELGDRIEGLMVEIREGDNQMHPEIMRTNKRIHNEAAAVLYGENWFTWDIYGMEYTPMWHTPLSETSKFPRHYSRLITKMRLYVSTRGADAIFWTTMNLQHACKVLSLNDFKILKVDFWNALDRRHGGSARTGYYGERCLESLKRCREALQFLINTYASPHYAAELKRVIEGLKDEEYWAYRKATEDEPENNYDEPKHSDLEELDEENLMGSEKLMSANEDEGVSGMEGVERN